MCGISCTNAQYSTKVKLKNKMNKYGKNTGYFWWKQRHKITVLKLVLIISVVAGMFWIARKQILGRVMFYEDYYNKAQSEQSR
jgi:hypothetical protein